MDKEKLNDIKEVLEELWNKLDDIKDDVDNIFDSPLSQLEDNIYGRFGIHTRLIELLNYLYDIAKEMKDLDADD
jgi:hypothetical protein